MFCNFNFLHFFKKIFNIPRQSFHRVAVLRPVFTTSVGGIILFLFIDFFTSFRANKTKNTLVNACSANRLLGDKLGFY